MTFHIGDLVTCRLTGGILWTVKGFARDPNDRERVTLVTKKTDKRGRSGYESRIAGIGDITKLRDAPTYAVGSTINYEGRAHLVLEDRGDDVEVGCAPHGKERLGGDVIRIPSGNVRTISKCDLVLANFGNP